MIPKLLLMGMPLLLSASLLDFRALDHAKEAYQEGNYTQTLNALKQVEQKSDEILYDQANSHYKLSEFDQALALYQQIQKPDLAFKKWHNSGNCYAQLGKLDEGIKAYEEALKLKEDKDTRFNLELLKKKKKKQEQQKKDQKKDQKKNDKKDQNKKDQKKNDQQNKKDQQNKDQKNQDQKNQKDQQSKDQKGKDQEKKDQKQKSDQQKKEDEAKKKEEQAKKEAQKEQKKNQDKDKDKKARQAAQQMVTKKEPISDKELRKYQKMLDKRGINTLMLPLKTKGEHKNEELKPW